MVTTRQPNIRDVQVARRSRLLCAGGVCVCVRIGLPPLRQQAMAMFVAVENHGNEEGAGKFRHRRCCGSTCIVAAAAVTGGSPPACPAPASVTPDLSFISPDAAPSTTTTYDSRNDSYVLPFLQQQQWCCMCVCVRAWRLKNCRVPSRLKHLGSQKISPLPQTRYSC